MVEESSQVQEEIKEENDVPRFDPFVKQFSDRNEQPKNNRRGRPANKVEKYVPTFMKEVLAKSFLKDPDNYLARLKAKERANQITTNLTPQLADEKNGQFRPETRPGQKPVENVVINFNSNTRPKQRPTNPELNFDSNFPWNPNSYDGSGGRFKGGYVFIENALNYDLDHQQQVCALTFKENCLSLPISIFNDNVIMNLSIFIID